MRPQYAWGYVERMASTVKEQEADFVFSGEQSPRKPSDARVAPRLYRVASVDGFGL